MKKTIIRITTALIFLVLATALLWAGPTTSPLPSRGIPVDAHASMTLSASQLNWTSLHNYQQTLDAAITLVPGAGGLGFDVFLATTVAKYWRLYPNGTNAVWVDGKSCGAGKYLGVASAAEGYTLSCRSKRNSAGGWDWFCSRVSGPWLCEP